MIQLGSEWPARVAAEPQPIYRPEPPSHGNPSPPPQAFSDERMIAALDRLTGTLLPVEAPESLDTAALANALAQAITAALTPLLTPKDDRAVIDALDKMTKRLATMDKRVMVSGSGGGNGVPLPMIANGGAVNTANPLPVTSTAQSNVTGTWAYKAAVSGTITVPAGGKVLDINAHCTTAGTLTINGGDSIPIPAGVGFTFTPLGTLVAPSLVFSGTDSCSVEFVV